MSRNHLLCIVEHISFLSRRPRFIPGDERLLSHGGWDIIAETNIERGKHGGLGSVRGSRAREGNLSSAQTLPTSERTPNPVRLASDPSSLDAVPKVSLINYHTTRSTILASNPPCSPMPACTRTEGCR